MTLFRTLLTAAAVSLSLTSFAQAGDAIHIIDPFARAASPTAKSGAAFMVIENRGARDERLVSASSDVAQRVELHTHREDANGVMRMIHVEEGFAIPAGASHALARGGDHVMFMGLTQPLEHGDTISVTLIFEHQGEVIVEIPVDLERKPAQSGSMDHSAHGSDARKPMTSGD